MHLHFSLSMSLIFQVAFSTLCTVKIRAYFLMSWSCQPGVESGNCLTIVPRVGSSNPEEEILEMISLIFSYNVNFLSQTVWCSKRFEYGLPGSLSHTPKTRWHQYKRGQMTRREKLAESLTYCAICLLELRGPRKSSAQSNIITPSPPFIPSSSPKSVNHLPLILTKEPWHLF